MYISAYLLEFGSWRIHHYTTTTVVADRAPFCGRLPSSTSTCARKNTGFLDGRFTSGNSTMRTYGYSRHHTVIDHCNDQKYCMNDWCIQQPFEIPFCATYWRCNVSLMTGSFGRMTEYWTTELHTNGYHREILLPCFCGSLRKSLGPAPTGFFIIQRLLEKGMKRVR